MSIFITSIVLRSSNTHHIFAVTSIITNNLTVHAPSSLSVSMHNNSHVNVEQAQIVSHALDQADDVITDEQTQQSQPVNSNCVLRFINNLKVGLLTRKITGDL